MTWIMDTERKPWPSDSRYEVDRLGRVWGPGHRHAKTATREMKPYSQGFGYLNVKGRRFHAQVHRMVLETFVGPCPTGMETCHANGIRTDNRPSNLRWGTRIDNRADQIRHNTGPRGERHPMSKLTSSDVLEIRRLLLTTPTGSISRIFGISHVTVLDIKSGRTWAHLL